MDRRIVLLVLVPVLLFSVVLEARPIERRVEVSNPVGSTLEVLSGSGESSSIDWWPMFLHDLNHTGFSVARGPKTNQTRWTFTTGNGVYAPAAVADGRVFIGSNDHKVYALKQTTGALIWNYTTGGMIFSGCAVANGIVYTGSQDHKVYALNETTGELIWNCTTGDLIYSSSPAVVDGIVYIGSDDFKLYALDAKTGTLIWNFTTSGKIYSSPAVVGGIVYIGSMAGGAGALYALNATTGGLIWKYDTGNVYYSSPVVSENIVYIGTTMQTSSKVYALNASTGSLIWYFPVGNTIINSPAVAYGMVYVGSYDYNLYALNKTSGSLVWKYYIGTLIYSSPALADGILYIGDVSSPAKMYAINATNGDLVWTFVTTWGSSCFQSSAAIMNSMLFVGCNNGKVYAIGEVHDIAITDVTPSKTVIGTGYSMSVNVTAANQGNYSEAFNATAYANGIEIETKEAALTSVNSTTITFSWNTTDFVKGNCTLSAYAWPVEDEINIDDNSFTDGWVFISIIGDVNGDGKVNLIDVFSVALAYGSYPGRPTWNPNYDINNDGKINLIDYFITALNYGKTDT